MKIKCQRFLLALALLLLAACTTLPTLPAETARPVAVYDVRPVIPADDVQTIGVMHREHRSGLNDVARWEP